MQFFVPQQMSERGQAPAMTSKLSSLFRRRSPAVLWLVLALLTAGQMPCHAESRTSGLWWTPRAVTEGGHKIDEFIMVIFWLTLAVFIITQVVYIYFMVKYRYRKGVRAVYSHGNNNLEIIWTSAPAVVFVALAMFSNKLWWQLRSAPPAGTLKFDIVAYQFGFHIRNPGQDGKLGAYDIKAMKKGDNNFGQDASDPASLDDYQSEGQLTIPVGQPVQVVLRSQDVIHAFYVPEFRMFQDMVPGRTIEWVWFKTDQTGHFALACNQLCGSGHYNMQAKIDVVSQADYDKLVKEKSEAAIKENQAKQQQAKTAAALPEKSPADAGAPVQQVAAVDLGR
jgi:cytochrome c oxidase subunit 2